VPPYKRQPPQACIDAAAEIRQSIWRPCHGWCCAWVPGGNGDRGDDVPERIGHSRGADPQSAPDTVHDLGVRSAAASPLVWGAAPDTACGWGGTAPWRVAQACVNSAPKNMIKAE
jgi:hypothetical protein